MSLFTEISDSIAQEEVITTDNNIQNQDFVSIRENYLNALCDKALELQNDPNFDLNEADVRFSTALNLFRVRNSLVAVIGAGGLGNWQWRILASMGFKRIAIYDDDNVGIENVGPQAHSVFDLDMPKVKAVENAALMYRGIKILARNKRVMSYTEICDDLGEDPDIVIGCTDSADFRNNFINMLTDTISSYGYDNQLPDLFIDYRMSLGDWVAYIVPAKAMKSYAGKRYFCDWYKRAAVFPASEAVQEPCTERAIAYTGANVASFTGAILHWFYSGGRQKFYDNEYMRSFVDGDIVMPGRKVSFSSRDFEFITDTVKEKKLERKISKMQADASAAWDFLRKGYGIPAYFHYYESGDAIPDNSFDRYRGKLMVLLKQNEVVLCGFNKYYSLERDSGRIIRLKIEKEFTVSSLQPYVVYGCVSRADLERNALLYLLFSEEDTLFRIVATTVYLRVKSDYIEQLRQYMDGSHAYERGRWEDVINSICIEPVCESFAETNSLFNKYANEFEVNNQTQSEEVSSDAQDENEGSAECDEEALLDREDLQVGMVVTIGSDDELLTISEIGSHHFKVRSFGGEETNYSLRRFPDVYCVSE